MSGPKRNPDKLNTIGVVVVGICGAVLVYVSIVALQAFYVSDTSQLQTMADYGGNDTQARSLRAAQVHNITEYGANAAAPDKPKTYRVNIDDAMKLVVESAKVDPSTLVPTQGRSDKATIKPIFGRPQPLVTPAPTPAPAPTPTDGTGTGSGSGAATAPPTAPPTPTGGQAQGGSVPAGGTGSGGTAAPAPKVNLPKETGAGSGSAAPKGNGP